jgi:uncharacterized protein (TIGR03032 family)
MSSDSPLAEKRAGVDASASTLGPAAPTSAVEFRYGQSQGFTALLHQLGVSLLVSTYQANKLLVVRAIQGGLSTLVRSFDRPMGLAVDGRRLALGTRNQIWQLRNLPHSAGTIAPAGQHDACYVPRSCHVTGDIAVHEMAWAGEELWLVNTRFSCLCTFHPDYSFVPRWRPPFITALTGDDRCHLNGLAMAGSPVTGSPVSGSPTTPKYVTALAETDTPGGSRAHKLNGGCVIDVPSGETVARGLCMPHSPRIDDGRIWLLESGRGRLTMVDAVTGGSQSISEFPGFTRGLAIHGPYAFIGLSKLRETATSMELPIALRIHELKCGVAAVDLQSGRLIGVLEFRTAVEEIFDVQVLPGLRFPEIIGFEDEGIQGTFILPNAPVPSGWPSHAAGG